MPLNPSKPLGAVYSTLRVEKSVPVKPLHFSIRKLGPALVMYASLRYSASPRQAMPPTNAGPFGTMVAVPLAMMSTPPFGVFSLLPESPANIAPPPHANEVGFFSPVANRVALAPPNVLGGGGPVAALAATPVVATAAAHAVAQAAKRTRMMMLSFPRM